MKPQFIIILVACIVIPVLAQNRSCRDRPDSGHCYARMLRYYFDAVTGSCIEFVYGGCGGNGNRYLTKEECLQYCKVKDRAKRIPKDCYSKPEMGPCKASMPRFFYAGGKCQPFIYGGCRGNANNYKTERECLETCAS